jgi:large subunit ribosomal protein L6
MKRKISESISLPEGVSAHISDKKLVLRKGSVELSRSINIPAVDISLNGNSILIDSQRGNKTQLNLIMTFIAHLKNMFSGLENKFVYKLQACNVHFPMTLKVEKENLLITNFLGEKKPRYAEILPSVHVDIKGQNITLSSHDKELAGQTAANIEKATKVRNRDRRIFQDGIYIIEKTTEGA